MPERNIPTPEQILAQLAEITGKLPINAGKRYRVDLTFSAVELGDDGFERAVMTIPHFQWDNADYGTMVAAQTAVLGAVLNMNQLGAARVTQQASAVLAARSGPPATTRTG